VEAGAHHVGGKLPDEAASQRKRLLPRRRRPRDDFVVDIREVADVGHSVAQVAQQAVQDVKGNVHACVACVKLVESDV
jgi:hypothetical protein